MNPGPPDLEFKVLTVLSDTHPNWKRMHRNQTKKQSDVLAVLVLKTKGKWWKISYVMGRSTPDSHMEVRCLQVEPREWSRQPLKKKNWALAMLLKALPLVHFWSILLLLKEQIMTSVRITLKTLV